MAAGDKKKENLIILEDIYHGIKPAKGPKKPFKEYLREYLKDSQRVEKSLSLAILIFGLAAVLLGFFQFKSDITKPFLAKKIPAGQTQDNQDLLGLKQKDTEQDGLSDYDELNIYYTSPYLKDSDSDGISDKKEIEQGTDPNCPEGQNCFAVWAEQLANATSSESNADLFSPGAFSQPERLRQLLVQAGVSAEELAQFSDEELIKIFQEIIAQNQEQEAGQPAKTITVSADEIGSLTPVQIRQMLMEQAGIAKTTLDSISDKELMELVKEILTAQTPGQVRGASNTATASNQNLTVEQVRQMTPAQIRVMLLEAGILKGEN